MQRNITMRDRIKKIFIEIKKKKLNNSINRVDLDPTLINDDPQKHLLQKPIQTGYSQNIP